MKCETVRHSTFDDRCIVGPLRLSRVAPRQERLVEEEHEFATACGENTEFGTQ
jgi:hypothetical protein